MPQIRSFLGLMPVRRGSFVISFLTVVLYCLLFIAYIVIYNKKELPGDHYTAFDIWMILAMIVHVVKVLMGAFLYYAVHHEIPGLVWLWPVSFFFTSLIGAFFDVALLILWSWWMMIPIIIAVIYVYFEMVAYTYYRELAGSS